MRKSLLVASAGLLLTAGFATFLNGCSAAKDLVNANIPPISDPLQVRGRGVKATATRAARSRVLVTVTGALEPNPSTFNDVGVEQADKLNSATISQSLSPKISVVPLGGDGTLPAKVVLSNLSVTITLEEGDGSDPNQRLELSGLTLAGPITFTRTSELDGAGRTVYAAPDALNFNELNLSNEQIDKLTGIISQPAAPSTTDTSNRVSATLSFQVEDDDLTTPQTDLFFTFSDGEARVRI